MHGRVDLVCRTGSLSSIYAFYDLFYTVSSTERPILAVLQLGYWKVNVRKINNVYIKYYVFRELVLKIYVFIYSWFEGNWIRDSLGPLFTTLPAVTASFL